MTGTVSGSGSGVGVETGAGVGAGVGVATGVTGITTGVGIVFTTTHLPDSLSYYWPWGQALHVLVSGSYIGFKSVHGSHTW